MIKIPDKPPITITGKAAERIRTLTNKNKKAALKVGIKKGGCAGMEYTMDFVDNVEIADEVIEIDGARVVVAAAAQMFLFGSEIDYEVGVLESGFKFNNPNVEEACGCGESIKFKDRT
ncbi:MAG: iron-sulfur cluster assembly accessory protein [Pseudomonadota bacterium]|nr:iron-sulfur cluster assembly accessory protein [Pseudomonadota bacterium]